MNLNEYFSKPKKFKKKIVVISVRDEASKYIKNFVEKSALSINMNMKFQNSFVAVIDMSRKFVYEKSAPTRIECSYKVGDRYIDIVSSGFLTGPASSIKIGQEEFSLNKNGLNIAIFKHKSLKFVDSFNCNSYLDEALTVKRENG